MERDGLTDFEIMVLALGAVVAALVSVVWGGDAIDPPRSIAFTAKRYGTLFTWAIS